jgi:hypothetical protein
VSAIDDEHLKYLFVGYLNGKSNERTNCRSLAPQFMQLRRWGPSEGCLHRVRNHVCA